MTSVIKKDSKKIKCELQTMVLVTSQYCVGNMHVYVWGYILLELSAAPELSSHPIRLP